MRRKDIKLSLVLILMLIFLALFIQDVKGDFVATDKKAIDPNFSTSV